MLTVSHRAARSASIYPKDSRTLVSSPILHLPRLPSHLPASSTSPRSGSQSALNFGPASNPEDPPETLSPDPPLQPLEPLVNFEPLSQLLPELQVRLLATLLPKNQLQTSCPLVPRPRKVLGSQSTDGRLKSSEQNAAPNKRSNAVLAVLSPFEGGQIYNLAAVRTVANSIRADVVYFDLIEAFNTGSSEF
jgi:hypothetical protein